MRSSSSGKGAGGTEKWDNTTFVPCHAKGYVRLLRNDLSSSCLAFESDESRLHFFIDSRELGLRCGG